MRETKGSALGDVAAGRPLLTSSIVAAGLAALAATAYRDAPASFASVSYAYIAALGAMMAAPAAIASLAPRNFWLRLFYASVAAGLILALRRIAMQNGIELGAINFDIALAGAAAATFWLALGAPLWRGTLRLALVGLCAGVLGATGGLSVIALEAARSGAAPAAGAALGLASSTGAALSVIMAGNYAGAFAFGADGREAASRAAAGAIAPALFALALSTLALAAGAFVSDAPPETAAIVGAGSLAAAIAAAIIMSAGALALKTPNEAIALEENRRRAELRPLLQAVRAAGPPSSSIAASAILLIATIVAGFDAASAATIAEIAVILAAFAVALVVFVSVRSALLLVVLLIVASRLTVWSAERFAAETPSESVRVIALALAALLFSRLALAWRDNRNPRRKALEVTQRAIAEGYFSFAAAGVLAVAALAAAEGAGLWDAGAEAALAAAAMATIGGLAAPAFMTAMGAVFGRD
jgi:hypothetical protein